jgi:hypothetical protein
MAAILTRQRQHVEEEFDDSLKLATGCGRTKACESDTANN